MVGSVLDGMETLWLRQFSIRKMCDETVTVT
ncbi:UNVERIFIED_ORG: hypothetical protein HNP28_003423 [Comamonas terrigena]